MMALAAFVTFCYFFLGFVRVHILHHAYQKPIYGDGIR